MKIGQLLTEDAPRGLRNVSWAGKLGYDPDTKHISGGAVRWLDKIKATAEDVDEAYEKAKSLPSYKSLTKYVKNIETPRRKKNGTFSFQAAKKSLVRKLVYDGLEHDKIYLVMANGQMRYDIKDRGHEKMGASIGKMASSKPHLIHDKPMESILAMYDNAFKRLTTYFEKKLGDRDEPSPGTKGSRAAAKE